MTEMTEMTELALIRADLIDNLRACRDAERAVFAALDPATRDAAGPDGGWSAKDNLAHLWIACARLHLARLASRRAGRRK